MEKKEKAKIAKTSSKAKKGERFACDACGMVVSVDQGCCCDPCNIVCCGQNMRLLGCC